MKKLVILIGLLGVIFISGTAHAYNVYNETSVPLYIHGEFCGPCLLENALPGTHVSCPGDDTGCEGSTSITAEIFQPNGDLIYYNIGCPAAVENHGYVQFYQFSFTDNSTNLVGYCSVTNNDGSNAYTGLIQIGDVEPVAPGGLP